MSLIAGLTASQIAELTLMIGWPAVQKIGELIQRGDKPVTVEEWADLANRVNRSNEEALGPRPDDN